MIEAAVVLLLVAVALFVAAVRLGMILGARLDRLVWSPPATDDGAEAEPRGAGASRLEPERPAEAADDEGSMG